MKNRLPLLDLTRGLAALGVMWFHFSVTIATHIDPAFPVFWLGGYGVQVFFVISGRVIVMTATRSASRRAFARARFIRLYPAFVAGMLLTTGWAVLCTGASPVGLRDWLMNLTMIPDWLGAKQVEGVYWTLGYEVAFYAVVCACLPWIKRGGTLWLVAASLPVLWWQPLVGWFLIGVVWNEFGRGSGEMDQSLADRFSRGRNSTLHERIGIVVDRASGRRIAAGNSWLGLRCFYCARQTQICAWLGAISYPLYLTHATIGRSVMMMLAPLGVWPAALIAVAGVVGIAAAVHHLVERPAQTALRRGIRMPQWQPVVIPEMF